MKADTLAPEYSILGILGAGAACGGDRCFGFPPLETEPLLVGVTVFFVSGITGAFAMLSSATSADADDALEEAFCSGVLLIGSISLMPCEISTAASPTFKIHLR